MINDTERFRYNKSPYERPNSVFRCGREARWMKPCHPGPRPDGTCGGTAECTPVKNANGYFECRRPAQAGGPCEEGPLPEGSCAHLHPPCVPQRTLRARRERLAFFFASLAVALIGSFLILSRAGSHVLSPLDPGPLSVKHGTFIEQGDCLACHAAHGLGPADWLGQIFVPNDLSNQCLQCHSFRGPALRPHTKAFDTASLPAESKHEQEITCTACHTEHKGDISIRAMNDRQCNACHVQQFESFSKGHPEFPENFPFREGPGISFDHAAHMNRYFKTGAMAQKAPETCLACHRVDPAAPRHVQTAGFEQSCTACHQAEISKSDLVLFRFPELRDFKIDPAAVVQACGFGPEGLTPEEFQSASFEEPAVVSSFLLGVNSGDADAYGKPIQQFLLAMAERNVRAISDVLAPHAASPEETRNLLSGLSPELVYQAACAWLANQEYEPLGTGAPGGWFADELELKYRPEGHGDPLAKNWIEWGLRVSKQSKEGERAEAAEEIREEFASARKGVGRCLKCHSVHENEEGEGKQGPAVAWQYPKLPGSSLTSFSHGPHLRLLGGGDKACQTCHMLKAQENAVPAGKLWEASRSFQSIRKETCLQCHGSGKNLKMESAMPKDRNHKAGQAREDCLLCHSYHAVRPAMDEGILKKMGSVKMSSKTPEIAVD